MVLCGTRPGEEDNHERRPRRKALVSRRALIVDEEAALSELFREAVGGSGMVVVTMSASEAATRHLTDEKYDVVLMGLHTPSLDGIELTRRVRSSGINRMTPIIVVSDDQHPSAVSMAFEAGASFFLYKPVDKARLLKLIRATQGSIENERRRFRRVPCHVKVRLTTDTAEMEGESLDLSLDGLLVRAPKNTPRSNHRARGAVSLSRCQTCAGNRLCDALPRRGFDGHSSRSRASNGKRPAARLPTTADRRRHIDDGTRACEQVMAAVIVLQARN